MAEQLNCEGEDMDCRLNLNNRRSLKSGTLSMILVPMHFLNLCDIPNIGGIPKVVAEVVKLQLSENMKVLMAFGWPAG